MAFVVRVVRSRQGSLDWEIDALSPAIAVFDRSDDSWFAEVLQQVLHRQHGQLPTLVKPRS